MCVAGQSKSQGMAALTASIAEKNGDTASATRIGDSIGAQRQASGSAAARTVKRPATVLGTPPVGKTLLGA